MMEDFALFSTFSVLKGGLLLFGRQKNRLITLVGANFYLANPQLMERFHLTKGGVSFSFGKDYQGSKRHANFNFPIQSIK